MVLPTFIFCGTQRGGTTTIFHYLKQHPEIGMSEKKDVHYFDFNFNEGKKWYEKQFNNCQNNKYKAIGEAPTFYIYLKEAPKRIYELLPNVKLIFIFRNPIDRAYSHYWHEIKGGCEYLSFENAINKEEERLSSGNIFNQQHYSYLDRGKYVIQLKRFKKYFPNEQMLILINKELKENPEKTIKKIYEFLEVDKDFIVPNQHTRKNKGKQPRNWKLQRLKHKLPSNFVGRIFRYAIDAINLKEGYPPMKPITREKLINYFKSYNNELEELLGKKLDGWDK